MATRAARSDSFRVDIVDLNEVVSRALDVVRPQLERSGISINEQYWDEPVRVAAAVSDLEAIVFNLATNAMSSFARAGDLLGDRVVQVRTRVEEGRAALDFSDSGPGIVDVDVAHMWRPGVTGPRAESAGLGLTVIRDAVADMCGRSSVVEDGDLASDAYGELGGASFRIRLPLRIAGE